MGPGMQTICEHTWQGFTCVTRCKFLQRFGKIESTYELSCAAAGLESLRSRTSRSGGAGPSCPLRDQSLPGWDGILVTGLLNMSLDILKRMEMLKPGFGLDWFPQLRCFFCEDVTYHSSFPLTL